MRTITAWLWLTPLGMLTGCVPDLPKIARPSQLPASVLQAAIPLEQAIAENLVKVTPQPDSTVTEMRLRLQPLQSSQPWIRIDTGWQIASLGAAGNHYVTHQARVALLPQEKSVVVPVPHLLLRYANATGIAHHDKLVRNRSEQIRKLLDAVVDFPKQPKRKHLQFAVWAVSENLSYQVARAYVGAERVEGKDRTRTLEADDLLQVADILERAEFDRHEFALWSEASAELDELIERYENLSDVDATTGLEEFRLVAAYYPMHGASNVVLGAFEKHQGEAGRPFRNHATMILKRRGGPQELGYLRKMAGFESDPLVLRALNDAIKAVAAPAR